MKKLRKSFAVLLTLALLMTFVVIPKAAEDTLKYGVLSYEVTDSEVIITDCEDTANGTIEIPSEIDSMPVTGVGFMAFYHCREIETVIIPDSVLVIGDRAFQGCYKLKSVDMSENLTSIGASAFDECVSLEGIELGDKVTYIGSGAFCYCLKLAEITIPNSVEKLTCTFERCDSLKEITVPSSVSVVGYHTFSYCKSLETVVFEEGVTELLDYAVVGCGSLESVTLPSTLKKIGLLAFAEDTQLQNVYFAGTQEEWDAIEIAEGNEPLINATVHFIDRNLKGDISSDGKVNSSDALLVLKHAVKSELLTGKALEKADLNKDGVINSSDALAILRIAVGMDSAEPTPTPTPALTTKQEIVEFYNKCLELSSEQDKIVLEGFTDYSAKVNKVAFDGKEDKEAAELFEDNLNAVVIEDIDLIFVNGETADGIKAEEVMQSFGVLSDDVDTAVAASHGDGYKITLTLYPVSYTMDEDEFTGEFSNYKSYSEDFSAIEVLAVTDGQGRVVILDIHVIQNIKATTVEDGTDIYMDFEIDQRDIYTFNY